MRPARTPLCLVGLAAVAVIVASLGCGGASSDLVIGAAGGSLCSPDGVICIDVPVGALDETQTLRISPGAEAPPAALSASYDISFVGREGVKFLKPATVRFSLDEFDASALSDIPDDLNGLNFLRIYTRVDGVGDWTSLGESTVDRVRNVVLGETTHLSPFVILRADRLPDGGLPIEIDGGPRDSGTVIVVPPIDGGFDAGHPPRDAGTPDSGTPDSGTPDAGPMDAGVDAGPVDAGVPDAGPVDAGAPDAGPVDTGVPDAGPIDAGAPDAGVPDAGAPDAGATDAGTVDAGEVDAGSDAG